MIDSRSHTHRVVPLVAVVLAASVCGCDREPLPTHPAPPPTIDKPAVPQVKPVEIVPVDPEAQAAAVTPVYPDGAKADPRAQRLCEVHHALPGRRRAECCQGKPGSSAMLDRCVSALSAALASSAVEVDETQLTACEAAAEAALQGCGWVGNLAPTAPAECRTLLRGSVEANEPCRSTTECADGLRCLGAGPTDPGVCRPPGKSMQSCNLAVDPLAALAGQDVDQSRECEGYCNGHRCEDAVSAGAKCTTSLQCGHDAHCNGEVCVAGLAAAGAPCAGGGCEPSNRCVSGICRVPAAEGESCSSDLDCRGACLKDDGAATGICGKRCQRVIAR